MTSRIFSDPSLYYMEMFEAVKAAQHQVDVEMYIFDLDSLGLEFLQYLSDAAKRGVQVRLLLDGFGSFFWTQAQVQKYLALGIQIRFYHPFSFRNIYNLNRRNHRKVVLIDRKICFSGSLNVSKKSLNWHETGILIHGESTDWISKSFEWLWKGSPLGDAPPLRSTELRSTLTRKMKKKSHKRFIEQVQHAKTRLWFVTPYLSPSIGFLITLFRAARRSVDVRILLPQESDVFFSKYLNRAFYAVLIGGGVRIFEFTPQVLHSKVSIIDEQAWVGSSNLNQRSLIHDLELDFLFTQKSALTFLKTRLLYDLEKSTEITPAGLRKWGYFGRLLSKIVFWFRRYF